MKPSFITASLSSLVALTSPTPIKKQVFNVGLTFYGVDGSSYGETFPADTTLVKIDNPTVVKNIYSNGGGFCTITGVDSSTVVIVGEGSYTMTPVQAQASGSCDNLRALVIGVE